MLSPLNAGVLSNQLSQLATRSRSTTNLLAETTAADSAAEKRSANEIGMDKPIETLQHFFDWFSIMESGMEKDQEDVYRNYLSVATFYRNTCDDFLEDLRLTKELFDALMNDYAFVEKRTRSLQTACEELLEKQERSVRLADALAERLSYFNHLEPIAKLFNLPGDDICLHPEFMPMLQTLDECIDYMQQHLSYRDSELYLMRFRQCMTRGMTLIKMYVVNSIKKLGYEIYKLGNATKPLTSQVEKRCEGHKEYQTLHRDMLNAYFQIRQQLLSPVITRKIQQLGPNAGDLIKFAQDGCAYMMNLCSDEFALFYNFFQSGEDELYHLYDYLRPRIIHETEIPTLSELCNIFQIYVTQENDNLTTDKSERREMMFGHLMRNIYEDAQARLVFRAQMFIHNDINKHQAKAEDFDTPAPFLQQQSPLTFARHTQTPPRGDTPATLDVEEDSDTQSVTSSHKQASTSDLPALTEENVISRGWFPTLQKTLWILSKLYRCVQTSVFEDFAQETVSLCNESLKRASEMLKTTKTETHYWHRLKSSIDGQLFLLKHLLVLKEQLTPFEARLVHADKELDFSHVTGSLYSYRSLPNALIGLAQGGIPRVVEISMDSRREIDREIKSVCEAFITESVQRAIKPVDSFSNKLSISHSTNNGTQQIVDEDELSNAIRQFKERTKEDIPLICMKLKEYINDYKMEQILIKQIEINIVERYKTFYRMCTGTVETKHGAIISPEAVAVWVDHLRQQGNEQ
ncbi:Golgi transport complex subunit 3 [Apophysomyces ossiformis]|uniref:Conserved oligomeric Golgi complex subunit 3 n=1 Tax=Apophysomyces ossiformis TaxID=679940 RepID=A0A8H7BNR3_9FUNG|nr:Golgi transport complex subunit 3 [Apophysomyces ossiformis]